MKLFGKKDSTPAIGDLVAKADALRDARSFAAAADAYAAAIAVAPDRAELRVQHGNMLKDSRRAAQAVEAYKLALSLSPKSADIYLQLGHALKILGRRAEAKEAYSNAAGCPGGSSAAERELISLGETQFLMEPERLDAAQAAQDAAMALSIELQAVKAQLARIEALLPGLELARAFPPEGWSALRQRLDIPCLESSAEIRFVADAKRLGVSDAHALVTSLFAQKHAHWTARFVGASTQCAVAIERLMIADKRVGLSQNIGEALSGAPSTIILLRGPSVIHENASGWIAHCSERYKGVGFTCDAEHIAPSPSGYAPVTADIKGISDPETLEESDCAGPLLVVPAEEAQTAASSSFDDWFVATAISLARMGTLGHIPLPLIAVTGRGTSSLADFVLKKESNGSSDTTIAVVIPTRDNGGDVLAFVESLLTTAVSPQRLEILIVDNGSVQSATLNILATLDLRDRIHVLRVDTPFNWSHLNNEAAKKLSSDLFVFANDDMVMRSHAWDDVLRSYLGRPEVGAVGARLCYADGSVQHAGILAGWNKRFIHDGLDAAGGDAGPVRRWKSSRRVAAVTGAFLALRRKDFESLGGFSAERFAISYGDVDLCFRLRDLGLAIVWTPLIEATHYETKTRGADVASLEKQARDEAEWLSFRSRWGDASDTDPSASPWWVTEGRPFRLLRVPSLDSINAFIRLTARSEPWRLNLR